MTKQTFEIITELLKKKAKYEQILICFDKYDLTTYISFKQIGRFHNDYWEGQLDTEDEQYLEKYFNDSLKKIEQQLKELGYYD